MWSSAAEQDTAHLPLVSTSKDEGQSNRSIAGRTSSQLQVAIKLLQRGAFARSSMENAGLQLPNPEVDHDDAGYSSPGYVS
jgi:hypothetical protein